MRLTRSGRTSAAVAVACALVVTSLVVVATQEVDVTGTWIFDVTIDDGGGGTPTVTLKQEGDQLTGHYSSDQLGEADLSGTVKGREITFSFDADVQGFALEVTYTGTVEGDDAISGTMSLSGFGGGTFTGKRQ